MKNLELIHLFFTFDSNIPQNLKDIALTVKLQMFISFLMYHCCNDLSLDIPFIFPLEVS